MRRRSSISPPPSFARTASYEMPNQLGMYPPQNHNRDYHQNQNQQDAGPSTYHQNQNIAYNPYPLPGTGTAFTHDSLMQQSTDLTHNQNSHQSISSYPNYLSTSRSTQATIPTTNLMGPSPDSVITSSTPKSGQNNLDLSGYLDPTDKVEPKMPFFHNNPSVVKGHAVAEEDIAAAGRTSDGEDPGEPGPHVNVLTSSFSFDAQCCRGPCSHSIVHITITASADQ